MTLRRVCSCILVPLFGLLAGCYTSKPGVAAPPAAHHSLWKATGKHSTVYLLGSVHLLKTNSYPLAPEIEQAFTGSQVVAFETDVGVMEQPATLGKLMAKCMLPKGQTLQDQLSPQTYLALSNYASTSGLPLWMFSQFKPGMAAMTLEAAELVKLGFQPDQGVDVHFYRQAKAAGKTIVPFETLEFQMGLITDLSKEEGETFIKTELAELKTLPTLVDQLITAWRNGDMAAMEKLMNSSKSEAPQIEKRLLTDRNERWLPQIQELLAGDKNAIVIVGAEHMVGKRGLVALLRKKGVKVVQE